MTTNPTDFASYAWGVSLKAANYSGGAGGTFTDLVSGAQNWTVQGATPTFATRNTQEGMEFSAAANQRIIAENYAVGEMTVVAIIRPTSTANMHVWGDANQAANGFSLNTNANSAQMFGPITSSGFAAASAAAPFVVAGSISPENQRIYVTTYDGTIRKNSAAFVQQAFDCRQMSIGGMRTLYFNGWMCEIHGFHRSLQFRSDALLDDMLLTLGAKVGL